MAAKFQIKVSKDLTLDQIAILKKQMEKQMEKITVSPEKIQGECYPSKAVSDEEVGMIELDLPGNLTLAQVKSLKTSLENALSLDGTIKTERCFDNPLDPRTRGPFISSEKAEGYVEGFAGGDFGGGSFGGGVKGGIRFTF